MQELFRTLLTGEPLQWQLTNAQRAALGMAQVAESWRLMEVPCGLLAMCETYVYLAGLRVMRLISCGEEYYEECCVEALLTEDGRIAPVKPGGKSVPLTAANLHKRRHTGVSLRFDSISGTRGSTICLEDHDTRKWLFFQRIEKDMTTADFAAWLEERIHRCPDGKTVL